MDKQTSKMVVRDALVNLRAQIKSAVAARDAYRAKLAQLDGQRGMYQEDYIQSQEAQAREKYMGERQALWPAVEKYLGVLLDTLDNAHNTLDLANPALVNAITIIRSIGAGMGFEDIHRINAQFAGDQAAMRLLKTTYNSVGITSTRELDARLYNVNDLMTLASQYGFAAFMEDGSLNNFASALSKIATLEGMGDLLVESLVDLQGFYESMATGAGLSAKNVKIAADGSVSFA